MCSFKSIYFVIFILNLSRTYADISDKRLCVDSECKEPVSLARTLLRYSSPDPRILSFAPNAEVTIYSKEAGSETNLWGAVIKGKRGYVPNHLIREYKIYKKPTLLVDTELNQKPQVPKEVSGNDDIKPDNAKKPYEVVDGTTIYLNPQDTVSPSTTESPVLSTALPSASNVADQKSESVASSKTVDADKKDTPQVSVVNNVLSSLSDWMHDDEDSEEIDAEGEEEDDGDEDEEESAEQPPVQTEKKSQELPKESIDINSLHNLPPEVKLSPYGLEVGQSLDETVNKNEEASLKKEEPLHEPKETDPIVISPPPTNSVDNIQQNTIESVSTRSPEVKIEEVKEAEVSALGKSDQHVKIEEDKKEESKSQIEVETVTKPAILEEQPLVNTTPNILKEQEQEDLKIEENNAVETPQNITIPEINNDNQQPLTIMPTLEAILEVSSPPLPENQDTVSVKDETSTETFTPPVSSSIPEEIIEENKGTDNKEEITNEDVKNDAFSDNHNVTNEDVKEQITENVSTESSYNPEIEVPIGIDDVTEATILSEDFPSIKIEDTIQDGTNEIVHEEIVNEAVQEENEETAIEDDKQNNQEENEGDIYFTEENPRDDIKNVEDPMETPEDNGGGIWSGLFSFFESSSNEPQPTPSDENAIEENIWTSPDHETPISGKRYCEATSESCNTSEPKSVTNENGIFEEIYLKLNSDIFLLLITTAGSVIILLFVYMALDRHKREAPLVARINKLEKELLITLKENELLQENDNGIVQEIENVPNDVVEQLKQRLVKVQYERQVLEDRIVNLEKQLETKAVLEEQIESLEKELETSTEVGMELNRLISEMLDPTNGSDKLKENVEQLQRQLLEQKDTINNISETLHEKETENRMLRNELERSKKVATDFQIKVDEMMDRILKIERERDQQQESLQKEIIIYQQRYNEAINKGEVLNNDIQILRVQLAEIQRLADIKTKEYQTLKESLNKVKSLKNDTAALKSLLDATSIKAEIQQLKTENATYVVQLQQEQAIKVGFEKKYQAITEEINLLKEQYEQADKEKVAVNSKLEVLNNYFKKRESELQEEIIKYKSIWDAKEGEATSTSERIRYMQEDIENYKAQNETLKQEIISQEIELKSQISMLEKKVHENWVTARQTERKLEDARQEAAQLRNRLTLRERAFNEERIQNRLQSPVEQNGELALSPHPIDSPASPPLLYGARDHITKSPPLPGLPPFLPPPPGAPFMPPPMHGLPPFMPPPPSMFPGDHRPPPLGRMSSPPLNSRYSPDTSAFSPYDRNSPSPLYDSEYGASPPPLRGYSPYNSRDDRRDYKRPPHIRTNGRNAKGSVMSSGSDHSNDSIDKINRKQSKMV